jgi:hypothetical protein
MITESGLKSIPEPFDSGAAVRFLQQHRIETAGWNMRQGGQVMLGGADKAMLLVPVDAGGGSAEIIAAAQPHFDEYQGISILQNQVDLALAAAVILL